MIAMYLPEGVRLAIMDPTRVLLRKVNKLGGKDR